MTTKDIRAMRVLLSIFQEYRQHDTFDVLLSANDRRLLIAALKKALVGRETGR